MPLNKETKQNNNEKKNNYTDTSSNKRGKLLKRWLELRRINLEKLHRF